MKQFLFILILITGASCKNSDIKKSFLGADSLIIHFKDTQAGTITKSVEATDPKAIKRIAGFIDNQVSEEYKCGYDGKMFFFSKGQQQQEVDFVINDKTCRHFSFLLNGNLVNTKMSNEAADFLKSLADGKSWY